MDFYPQYHTTGHETKCIEFRVEILGSVSTFIDPSHILPYLLLSHIILWDSSGNISV